MLLPVSIPRSGFCVFGQMEDKRWIGVTISFNPSVGILCFRTATDIRGARSNRRVSIPRSGFCVFGPTRAIRSRRKFVVSIPRSGFCVFGRPATSILPFCWCMFQSLGRDSVFSDSGSLSWASVQVTVSIPRSGFCVFGPRHSR